MAENCGHLKLVSLEKYGFVLDPRYHWEGWTPSPEILGRDTAVLALVSAKASLPPNWNFKIWDMHRTREVQIRMIRSFRDRIRAEHPEWGELTVMRGVYKFAAKAKRVVLRPDCHRNGGAVDLTIVDDSGREIDMGTDHDDLSERARFDYFERLPSVEGHDRLVVLNRLVLHRIMTKAGFVGNPREWWHWSTVL